MQEKSYFASSIQAAIAVARAELGEDLLLVRSAATTAEQRHLGDYEVTFACAPESECAATGAGKVLEGSQAPHSFRNTMLELLQPPANRALTPAEKLVQLRLSLADLSLPVADADRVVNLISECLSAQGAGRKQLPAVPQDVHYLPESEEKLPALVSPNCLGPKGNYSTDGNRQRSPARYRAGDREGANVIPTYFISLFSVSILLLAGAIGSHFSRKHGHDGLSD